MRQRRELPDLRRQAAQLVAVEVKPRQRRELADLRRQAAQLVSGEVKLLKRRELANLRRQAAQLVAGEEKHRQRRELADLRRQAAQLVPGEVKHRQRRELANLRRQAAQLVLGEVKHRQRSELPNLRRQAAQTEATQVQSLFAPETAGFDFLQCLVVGHLLRWGQCWVLHGLVLIDVDVTIGSSSLYRMEPNASRRPHSSYHKHTSVRETQIKSTLTSAVTWRYFFSSRCAEFRDIFLNRDRFFSFYASFEAFSGAFGTASPTMGVVLP